LANAAEISLIVGLGNPGAQYVKTRHNAGFWFVDALAARCAASFKADARLQAQICRIDCGGRAIWLLKPETFMNSSGRSVAACASYYKLEAAQILIAHDELALACGALALKRGGGHGGHNGLRDITAHLGADFVRARIGIGRPSNGQDVARYVLNVAPAQEERLIMNVITDALDASAKLIGGDIDGLKFQGRPD
jgi:PTH1 family peptidyl-tRNA hydrolase